MFAEAQLDNGLIKQRKLSNRRIGSLKEVYGKGMVVAMERYNQILFHKKYKEYIDKNNQAEANRRFCRHNMGHFLDVARIAMILYQNECYEIGNINKLTQGCMIAQNDKPVQDCEDRQDHKSGQALRAAGVNEKIKDIIYGAALLHDVGRWMQYAEGIPHEKAGVMLAGDILLDCGYDKGETVLILEAIGNHRNADIRDEKNLSGLLYRADKLSRACFACEAEAECDWKKDKKNLEIFW